MSPRRAPEPAVPSWADRGGEAVGAAEEWESVGPVGGSTRLQAALTRGLAVGLWSAIALALALGLVNCAQTPVAAPPADDPAAGPEPVPPPGGCAELVVAAWVAGDAGLLDGLPGATARQSDVERQAVHTYTAAVDPAAAPERWGFLVAAELQQRDPEEGDWQDLGVQHFAVTMVRSGAGCDGWAPAALPMQVAPPTLAGDPALPYTVTLASSGTELSDTLDAFFHGLLAGGDGLERYVAPGVFIPSITPAPYREVSLTELRAWTGSAVDPAGGVPADGTIVRLLATVRADPADLPLAYPVTVGVRGGRWEVTAVDRIVAAPDLPPRSAPTSPPSTTASAP